MIKNKTILVAPLDWGLGHASRCVPLIKKLLNNNNNVIIGADKQPLALLRDEFPDLAYVTIPGYDIEYAKNSSFIKLSLQSLAFYRFIKFESDFLKKLLQEHKIDVVISDNRYGLWNKDIHSILITHQVFIKSPVAGKFISNKTQQLIANFDECWIPDFEQKHNSLSGELSHLQPLNNKFKFIGPLSRFNHLLAENTTYEYDIIAIISGPEPQRSIFENKVLDECTKNRLKTVIVRGLPNNNTTLTTEANITVFNHLKSSELEHLIALSKLVICRSGYSSIMDLSVLKKKAILTPTPGQPEQEYLADYHKNNKQFLIQQQNSLDLSFATY